MTGRVLKSFLIGIGWDTSKLEAGDQKIKSSLSSVKTNALGISAAIVGAFGALATSVNATANRVDQLALRTQNLRTGTNAVYNFGNAIRLMGGDASEAVDALSKFEEIQNNLRLKGDAGPIRELAMAGIDTSTLYKTQTGEEFLKVIADMIPSLDEGQRSVVQSSLGLSDATFRSISQGFDELSQSMDKASYLTGNIDGLVDNSRRLKETSASLGLAIEGITNELAQKFMPALIGFGQWANDWLSEHRGQISGVIDAAADNPAATATLGASASASVFGAVLSRLGLTSLGGLLGKTGTFGVALSGGAIGARAANSALQESSPTYAQAARGFDRFLMDLTGLDRINSPLEVLFGGGSPESVMPPAPPEPEAKEVQAQNVDDIVMAMQKAKVNVANNLTLNVELDGRAIEAKIKEVNGRQNSEAMNDLQTTTDR